MNLLIQTQLSNYNANGKFILECDSGWQMMLGRARVFLKIDSDIDITIMCPFIEDCITSPYELNADLIQKYPNRIHFLHHKILPNALATRYDFDFQNIGNLINDTHKKYDVIYINDPMLLRNYKALFFLTMKYRPRFVTHSHFIDETSCPKFPVEASLWQGQVEAARKSDYNFWQCESALDIFTKEMALEYKKDVVDTVLAKSRPFDDGYSSEEINSPVDMNNLRFNPHEFLGATKNKVVLFVPNRIGDGKRSSDYTGCGHFLFDVLPNLRLTRDDFVVVCGNPNQKFSNDELVQLCGHNGYLKLVPDSFNRDEYKWIAKNSHIVGAFYRNDSYGGTSSRECIDLGLFPLMIDNYEYSTIARLSGYENWLVKKDLSDIVEKTSNLIDDCKSQNNELINSFKILQKIVFERCSYEKTCISALNIMKQQCFSKK